MGENMFCMQSEKIFLRLKVRFVQCRDALMQILVRLDIDKNSSISTAGTLVASEKRRTVGLCLFFFLWRLPIGFASERRITVGLFVKKTTNWACEWGETYGRTCFIFLLLFSWPTLGLKKKFCFTLLIYIYIYIYIYMRVCVCVCVCYISFY